MENMEKGDDARTRGQGNEGQTGDMMTQRAPPTDAGLREPRCVLRITITLRVFGVSISSTYQKAAAL